MEILKTVAAVPGHVIEKVVDKVSATRDHARDAIHRVIERVEDFVGIEHHGASASAAAAPATHIRKEPGHKKPRAERRRARRAARHAS
jgi:hypothetical protein